MARQREYQVVLLNVDECELTSRPVFGSLKEAKDTARYLASDAYANVAESTHENMQSSRVEVRDEAGEIVWDCEVRVNAKG
jgi:hypothetical protein